MSRIFIVTPLLILFLTAPASGVFGADAYGDLPPPLAAAVKRLGLVRSGLSIVVQEIDAPDPVIAFAPDTPRNPASTMKLLTTLAALEELGPAYTWKTEVYTDAPVRNGHVKGNLYIKGYGDPYLINEHFWRLVRGLRATGIQSIAGDLVLDQSYFAAETGDSSEFDGQYWRAYNVLPRALLVNFQAINFRFRPDTATGKLQLIAEPKPTNLEIENRIRLTSGRCRGWARRVGMRILRRNGIDRVIFSGTYDADCGDNDIFRVVSEPAPYIHGLFAVLWREQGGRFEGGAREAETPPQARLLYTANSPPLADVIRAINKYSNNVMTRQVVLTLAAERKGSPGTTENGVQAVREWLVQNGLRFPELVLDNGAGLSRVARISARHMAQLLQFAYRSPYMPEFMSSLPISALDPMLKKRFGGALAGRLHVKTGYLNGVRSVAGYVLDRRGRRAIVVMMYNHASARAAEEFQETLLNWVYARP